jgi:hypothetical protein
VDTTREAEVLGAMGWGTKGFRTCRPWNKGDKKAYPNMGVDFVCYSCAVLADGVSPVDEGLPEGAADDRPLACVVQQVRNRASLAR